MDLSTSYLGLDLPHPFMVGAGPLSDSVDVAKQCEDAGAAAIVMRSLFEEQITQEVMATLDSTESHADTFGEALSYLPDPDAFMLGPDAWLETLRQVKEALSIPVFASLNGCTPTGWLEFATLAEQAGADALELNSFYVATDAGESGAAIEQRQVDILWELKKSVRIPIAVKLSPFYTSLAAFGRALADAGADGLVLFNRFFEPDIDLDELEVRPFMALSSSAELRLRLRWLALLSGQLEGCSLAVTGGVHTPDDAVKACMAGAHAVQLVSAVLRGGTGMIGHLKQGLTSFLEEREYEDLKQMLGCMNSRRCPDPEAYARGNYIRLLQTWEW